MNIIRRRRAQSSLMISLVILICVHCSNGGVITERVLDSIVPSSCGGGLREYLGGVLVGSSSSDASHFEEEESGGSSNGAARAEFGSNTTLCKSAKNECCTSSLIPKLLPALVPLTFNNSQKYNAFKTQINTHLNTMKSFNESGNAALWNATLEGMTLLRNWGLKYWDPHYLQRHNVFSNDCMRILVQNWVCPGCGEVVPEEVKPCKSLCHNTVMGCLKSPLAEFIEAPWKHAVNSVRTTVRLVMTTSDGSASGVFRQDDPSTHPLSPLVNDLNDWREPITWWLPEYKRATSCENLPTTACWNGESVGRYEFTSAQWRSVYNPEFSDTSNQGVLSPNVILELDKFRNELVGIRKTLEKYWPTASHHSSPVASLKSSALPLTSQEVDVASHIEGSGDSFDSDDEDLEYINSGYGPHIDSDDEDLGGYGGSGSGDDMEKSDLPDPIIGAGSETNIENDRPPVRLDNGDGDAGELIRPSWTLFFLLPALFILN